MTIFTKSSLSNFMLVGFASTIFSIAACGNGVPAAETGTVSPSPTPTARKPKVDENKKESAPVSRLDQFAVKASVPVLRKSDKADSRREVRIWNVLGTRQTRGLILEENSASFLTLEPNGDKFRRSSVSPKQGWADFWKRVTDLGLFDLPDNLAEAGTVPEPDSNVVYVETKQGKTYRVFRFEGLCYARSADAAKLLEVLSAAAESFAVEIHHCRQ